MKKHQYHTELITARNFAEPNFIIYLDSLGDQGWEMVGFAPCSGAYREGVTTNFAIVFKREIE